MKTIAFIQFEPSKAADIAQASDRFWTSPPTGTKRVATYILAGGLPTPLPGQVCSISVIEAESEQALLSWAYTASLAGASVTAIPALETPAGPEIAKVEEGLRR
jgi:hypothetical protein